MNYIQMVAILKGPLPVPDRNTPSVRLFALMKGSVGNHEQMSMKQIRSTLVTLVCKMNRCRHKQAAMCLLG